MCARMHLYVCECVCVCVSQGWIFDLGADGCTPMLLQGDQTVLVYIILKDKKKGENEK